MLIDLLKKRCSVRTFQQREIHDEIVDAILEAGRLSPSGGNEQPWKFGVITDKELIGQIAEAAYKQDWIQTAPLLIVLCTDNVEDERGAREIQKRRFPKYSEEISCLDKYFYSALSAEEHQTKIPGAHMVLQALEHGVYSTWISYFQVDKVSNLLGLTGLCMPSEIIAFGYPGLEPVACEKKDVTEITFYNRLQR